MNRHTLRTIHAVETAVARLLEECRTNGSLYAQHCQAVAQVSRTSKWLLNALTALRRAANHPRKRQPARPD
jgi:hypothetical protein